MQLLLRAIVWQNYGGLVPKLGTWNRGDPCLTYRVSLGCRHSTRGSGALVEILTWKNESPISAKQLQRYQVLISEYRKRHIQSFCREPEDKDVTFEGGIALQK